MQERGLSDHGRHIPGDVVLEVWKRAHTVLAVMRRACNMSNVVIMLIDSLVHIACASKMLPSNLK